MKISSKVETGIVRSNRETVADHLIMNIELPRTFKKALPGQFIMLRKTDIQGPFLARPFSIYSQEDVEGTRRIDVLYRVVGEGTALFSSLRNGDTVEVLGPLGRGFEVDARRRKIVIIAGGVGVAPVGFLAEWCRRSAEYDGMEITAYMGARSEAGLAGLDRMEITCDSVKIATDDGSRGFKGTVVELFKNDLELIGNAEADLYTCGPRAMMRDVTYLAAERELPCQVSMEERMACGIGVCLGCAVKIISPGNQPQYRRVCVDGPVFNAGDIDWDEC